MWEVTDKYQYNTGVFDDCWHILFCLFQAGYNFYSSLTGGTGNSVNIGTAEMLENVKTYPNVPVAAIQSISTLQYAQSKIKEEANDS